MCPASQVEHPDQSAAEHEDVHESHVRHAKRERLGQGPTTMADPSCLMQVGALLSTLSLAVHTWAWARPTE